MWLAIKIGVFYGAPALAVAAAIACFVMLWMRVRRGAMSRARAAALCAGTLLLPLAAVVIVWGTAELAGYFATAHRAWDAGTALGSLIALLPLAAYVALPIAALVVAFWLTLTLTRRKA